MNDRWVKPEFREVRLGGECTAYAGRVPDDSRQGSPCQEREKGAPTEANGNAGDARR